MLDSVITMIQFVMNSRANTLIGLVPSLSLLRSSRKSYNSDRKGQNCLTLFIGQRSSLWSASLGPDCLAPHGHHKHIHKSCNKSRIKLPPKRGLLETMFAPSSVCRFFSSLWEPYAVPASGLQKHDSYTVACVRLTCQRQSHVSHRQ